jgi:uncharacterized protein with NRDE domain
MCLLIFAHQVAADYPLLVAANRDEFHARPTAVSGFWPEYPAVLAGRDLQQGGTWMGVSRDGRFAAVTNYRDPSRTASAPRSRGELPLGYLTGEQAPLSFLNDLATRAQDYAGFNLLVGDRHSLCYFSNGSPKSPIELPPGLYGLSNASLDTPWPKVELGKARLKTVLEGKHISHDALSGVVADRELAQQKSLENREPESAMEALLSAQFIVTETYGTRSCTTVWFDAQGGASWLEKSFSEGGDLLEMQQKKFSLTGNPK